MTDVDTRPASVPFLSLSRIHESLAADVLADLADLLATGAFANGPAVAAFEQEFADYCDAPQCVGTANGLDALRLSLQAFGIGPGDEVIVPAQTFIATWEAVSQVGAIPVPVDVSEDDWNMDPAAVEAAVTAATRCLLPVHLYGQLADMSTLRAIADKHGLKIVEDACQAHGARRDGYGAGTLGDAACFSFYPGKNLGAMGDAGAMTTADGQLATDVRMLREHGQRAKYEHDAIGWTSRLDSFQAAVLSRKLPFLDRWNTERRDQARRYNESLEGVGDLVLPPVPVGSDPVWHVFVVSTEHPVELGDFLRGRGVATGRHYPEPPHLSGAYRHLGHAAGSFPVSESLATGCLSLPVFPGMTEAEVELVTHGVVDFFAS